MELTPLAAILPYKSEWRVEVKVLHTWKHYTKLSGETLEIILSDVHGTKILASCKKTYFEKFAKKVPVGSWRSIENFSINNPGVTYRPTNHQYKINFIYGTDITPSNLQNDSMFLSLVDFQTIQQGVEDENILIVADLEHLQTVLCSGKERKKIEFSLTDLDGHRIACCLWGKFAESIEANCNAAGGDTVICLLRFVKVGTYRYEIQISNSYDASQIFFNPPIMETEAFLKRDVASNAMTLVESQQDKLEREIRRDKWMPYPIRDIAELLQ
uniref:Replication protein A 70 kDa DNA-binding subunit B/D first OB fold domain-containing protein n=1 Tax=Brassica oleracea var. oleracea TaxID=109376 RepID=A0A0D3DT90_BRAOL